MYASITFTTHHSDSPVSESECNSRSNSHASKANAPQDVSVRGEGDNALGRAARGVSSPARNGWQHRLHTGLVRGRGERAAIQGSQPLQIISSAHTRRAAGRTIDGALQLRASRQAAMVSAKQATSCLEWSEVSSGPLRISTLLASKSHAEALRIAAACYHLPL